MLLVLKLVITPLLITMVTLAGRRWGPGVGGLLIGLPLTSGPISLILATQYGVEFASRAAHGNLLGQASVCLFCLAYSFAAHRLHWFGSTIIAILAFFCATVFWNKFSFSLWSSFAILALVIIIVLHLIPSRVSAINAFEPPRWDLPARMITATAFVFLLTTFANFLGAQLSGLLSPFPVFGNVIAAFTHQQQGSRAAAQLLRGIVFGSWAYAFFFLVVGGLLTTLGIVWTYTLATLVAVSVSGISFCLTRSNMAWKPVIR